MTDVIAYPCNYVVGLVLSPIPDKCFRKLFPPEMNKNNVTKTCLSKKDIHAIDTYIS